MAWRIAVLAAMALAAAASAQGDIVRVEPCDTGELRGGPDQVRVSCVETPTGTVRVIRGPGAPGQAPQRLRPGEPIDAGSPTYPFANPPYTPLPAPDIERLNIVNGPIKFDASCRRSVRTLRAVGGRPSFRVCTGDLDLTRERDVERLADRIARGANGACRSPAARKTFVGRFRTGSNRVICREAATAEAFQLSGVPALVARLDPRLGSLEPFTITYKPLRFP